jgi:hypothetical protein
MEFAMNDNPRDTQENAKQTAISRRNALGQSAAGLVALGCTAAGCATGPKMPGNLPKAEAQYQDNPKGLARCGICKHFISPNACEVVAGPVQSDGWCRFYSIF